MVFNPNRPIASENLSDSQPLLLSNNQDLDNSFGVDHYKFSNATGNNGFHNKVTTPPFVDSPLTGNPPVTTTNPILFAFQQTANLGVLQYSRGPNNAVITPLTKIYSPSTPLSIGNSSSSAVFDFTGIALAQCVLTLSYTLVLGSSKAAQQVLVKYDNAPSFVVLNIVGGRPDVTITTSGSILSITTSSAGALTNLFWTLDFERIQT